MPYNTEKYIIQSISPDGKDSLHRYSGTSDMVLMLGCSQLLILTW